MSVRIDDILTDDPVSIETVRLTKRFGRVTAVDNLSLRVARGSTYGLIGPNGAGKSTTLKMLMGILRPTSGMATVGGRDISLNPVAVKRRVGYVPEAHLMDRWMRVGQVVGFCRAQFPTWNDRTCGQMLERFGIDTNKKVKQLSKGMLVKLSLVLAVSHEPEVLLLDEPMAGLDPLAREEFLDGVLRTICERGQTVVISTHSLDDVQRLADTVGILDAGRLLVERRVDELLATTKRLQVTLTNGHRPEWVPAGLVWQQLHGREWQLTVAEFSEAMAEQMRAQAGVEHVDVVDLGLEDLFKDLVRGRQSVSA